MKLKTTILALLAVVGVATTAFVTKTSNYTCQYGQCSKIKSDGYRCKNCCQEGSFYCWSHNN